MDHLTKAAPRLVEEHNAAGDSNAFSKIIPALMKKGLENVNLSMFSEEKKMELLNAAAEEYLKRNQVVDAIKVFMMTGNKKRLIEVGDDHVRVGLYSHAIEAYKLAGDHERLTKIGDKCLEAGHITEAIAAYKVVADQDRLNKVGDYCLEKGKIDFAIEVYAALENKTKLNALGDKCFGEKNYMYAHKAYAMVQEKDKLNRVGEEFMKMGLLANALRSFEAADNQMMVQFIKENFSEKNLAEKVYV